MGGQIVGEHADIGLRAVEAHALEVGAAPRRVDPRHQALGGGFLVAGGAVDLTREKEARQRLQLKPGSERPGVDIIVFNRVARSDHSCTLEPGDRLQQGLLDLGGEAGGNAVGIDGIVVQPLRLEEDLMMVAIGKPHHLVLDGGTITRPTTGDLTAIDRGKMEVGTNDAMRCRRRRGDGAGDLPVGDALGERAERLRLGISPILVEPLPINAEAIKARWSAGFQPPEGEAQPFERQGKPNRRGIADAARGCHLAANMDHPA